ncbi:hypothetical protein OG937_23700 [Streptomyces sp. NBC_00510]
MGKPGWIVVGVVASSAFCWGIAGAIDMGLDRSFRHGRSYYSFSEGGGWYEFAWFAGFIAVLACVYEPAHLPDWKPLLSLTVGCGVGVAAVLLMGREDRHWIGAFALALAGVVIPLTGLWWHRTRRVRLRKAESA